jgi:hypothetical protein
VAVLRGVRVGLGGVVGSGVQVGSIRFRGVLLGWITSVVAGAVGEGVAGAAQLASRKPNPTRMNLIRFTHCPRAAYGSFRHSLAARRQTDL